MNLPKELTRRSVLRTLGTLGAAQSLLPAPLQALAASAAESQGPTPLYILFEGPWFFSPDPSGNLLASAILGTDHSCLVGTWVNAAFVPVPGISIAAGNQWTTTSGPVSKVYKDVVPPAFQASNAPYIADPDLKVKFKPASDVSVNLPVPDAILFSGCLSTAVVTASATTYKFYTDTILQYNQAPSLKLKNGASKFSVPGTSHLIFRLQHIASDDPVETDHVKHAFLDIQTRLSTMRPTLAIAITSVTWDPLPPGFPFTEAELGLGSAPPTHPGSTKTTSHSHRVGYGPYANCAGGGGGGGCNGLC